MNYYDEIKNRLCDNEVYARVKDYSKERTYWPNTSIYELYR